MKPLELLRFVAGVIVASLAGALAVGALFANTPLSDWVGLLSIPLNVCGYHRSPEEYPCLARLFIWLAFRLMAISFVFWSAAYITLLRLRAANLPFLLLAGAVIGALGGIVMKIFWAAYITGDYRTAVSSWSLVDPNYPWAAANGALISAALGVAMAGVFRVIVAPRSRRDVKA